MIDTKNMLSESKFYMGYSRWDETRGRYETWEEAVSRVIEMHRKKYEKVMTPELSEAIDFAEQAYKEKLILAAQRSLQFGGEQLFKHNARMYNCSVSYADRPEFFQEAMYLLLCGCGVGFSVQKHHVEKLPEIRPRSKKRSKVFTVPDSIEGWADAYGVLLSSFLANDAPFPAYQNCQVHFDFSKIRPKGSMISGGFKAPGPEGLRASLIKCESLLDKAVSAGETTIKPIVAYDFVMHMSDAVLSGGVRRSATICVFDKDDKEMLGAKTGNWFIDNPQRGRSNNSAMIIRDELTREEWAGIVNSVKSFGEPGFIFSDNKEFLYNPCVEIGMMPVSQSGESGFQFCNLNEINGGKCTSKDILFRACKAAAILGTLQAGYTDFKYLSKASKEITEREALIGVSITGWMSNPEVLFDETNMVEGANIVKQTNAAIARLIGINQAARTTCAKPSGNASVILGTDSGIHGAHAPLYFRNVQMSDDDEVAKLIKKFNPKMVERSVWSSNGTDVVVSFPIRSKEGSIYKSELLGVKQLDYVKKAQQFWVEAGTNVELCVDKNLRHNISNTITVDNWDEVEQYIYDNRQYFAGISLLGYFGDKVYAQAPFTEVMTAEQISNTYGVGSMFASGLVVEGLRAFDNKLWLACDTALGFGMTLTEESEDLFKRDWVRRLQKFADNFFEGDKLKATFCLKDVYNLHKWVTIEKSFVNVDFAAEMPKQDFVDADTLASQGCAGGACEITF